MTATLLSMLGALLCALLARADVMPQSDFQLQRMAGKWYLIGFATNAHWFVSKKSEMKMGTAVFVPTAGGDLDMTYTSVNSDGSCWKMTHLAKKTDIPGRFTFRSQRWSNDNDMRVVSIKYDEYALIHTIKTKGGVSEVLNKMYSRSTDLSPELMQKFEQFSKASGVLPENIVFLAKNGECPDA
ncbi:lipocalin-like [Megalops cyprinoides]|uniref:lipocalin-like n=1 Tax=Megalops cyprinoides TaxID=118141 RepID=UPI00186563C7|nr:lipocalin-like [Megalops cyprinoides]